MYKVFFVYIFFYKLVDRKYSFLVKELINMYKFLGLGGGGELKRKRKGSVLIINILFVI